MINFVTQEAQLARGNGPFVSRATTRGTSKKVRLVPAEPPVGVDSEANAHEEGDPNEGIIQKVKSMFGLPPGPQRIAHTATQPSAPPVQYEYYAHDGSLAPNQFVLQDAAGRILYNREPVDQKDHRW